MNTNNKYMTSYKAGHRFLPTLVFESNVRTIRLNSHWAIH